MTQFQERIAARVVLTLLPRVPERGMESPCRDRREPLQDSSTLLQKLCRARCKPWLELQGQWYCPVWTAAALPRVPTQAPRSSGRAPRTSKIQMIEGRGYTCCEIRLKLSASSLTSSCNRHPVRHTKRRIDSDNGTARLRNARIVVDISCEARQRRPFRFFLYPSSLIKVIDTEQLTQRQKTGYCLFERIFFLKGLQLCKKKGSERHLSPGLGR